MRTGTFWNPTTMALRRRHAKKMAAHSEEQQLEHRLKKLFEQALKRYSLIQDGDRILVGLSGGKDSMAMLELLSQRSRIFRPRFSVEAVYVRMSNIPYQTDEARLAAFAQELGVTLHVAETSFRETADDRRSPCFLCSWHRRKMLFHKAKELGCNKIALGHHRDDLMQTALMNLTYEGRFSTMPPRMTMDKFPMEIIRPLCLMRESDLRRFALQRNYFSQPRRCPYENDSRRADMKRMVEQFETLNPEFAYTFFTAIERTFPEEYQK